MPHKKNNCFTFKKNKEQNQLLILDNFSIFKPNL